MTQYYVAADNRRVTLDVEGKGPDRILQEIPAVAEMLTCLAQALYIERGW